jgi:hypothetical protein
VFFSVSSYLAKIMFVIVTLQYLEKWPTLNLLKDEMQLVVLHLLNLMACC